MRNFIIVCTSQDHEVGIYKLVTGDEKLINQLLQLHGTEANLPDIPGILEYYNSDHDINIAPTIGIEEEVTVIVIWGYLL